MVRLSEGDRATVVATVGGMPFEPSPGRAMREYVELPSRVAGDSSQLNGWLQRGRAYVQTLPKKAKR